MKRKGFFLLTILALILCLVPSAMASGRQYISDEAGLLTSGEEEQLENFAVTISESYGIDAAVLTVDTLDGKSAQSYADDYYDRSGYAEDGLLFLISMEEREWYITTAGTAIYAFTDYGLMLMEDQILPHLSAGEYCNAFSVFFSSVPAYMDAYLAGTPIDGRPDSYGSQNHSMVVYYEPERSFGSILLVSVFIGLLTAGAAILIMRYTMNTKRPQRAAGDYLTQGSFRLHTQRDVYLYSNVSKVRRQQNSGSSAGGSSVHRSSGGRSHGGRGGKF